MGFIGDWIIFAFKVLVATVLAGAIGYRGEAVGRPVGFRAMLLLSVGAAMLIDSFKSAGGVDGNTGVTFVAAGILVAAGFIGASFLTRTGERGAMTTALRLWFCAAIGILVGMMQIVPALMATALAYIILNYLGKAAGIIDADEEEGD